MIELDELMQYVVPDALQLCMNFVFLHAPFVAEELAAVVAAHREAAAGRCDSGLARVQPRRPALRDALVRRRRGRGALRARRAALRCAARRSSTRATRSGSRRCRCRRSACATSPAATRAGRRWSGATRRAPGSRRRASSRGCRSATRSRNVAAQRDDPGSILTLTRDLIALRRQRGLLTGAYAPVDAPPGVWAFRRGGGALVALNLGDGPARLDGVDGAIVLCTDRSRDGEALTGGLELRPREAVVAAAA